MKENGVPDGTPVPEQVRKQILKEAKKRGILQTLEEWANGFEEAQLLNELAS